MSPASSAYFEHGVGLQSLPESFSNPSGPEDLFKPKRLDHQLRSQELILRLVKAAVAFGAPSHRLKAISHSIGHSMQCTANLYFLDGHAYLEFPAKVAGVPPALFPFAERPSMDFTKLSLLMSLVKKILRHPTQSSVDDLLADLAQIEATPSAFSSVAIGISYVFTAATAAIMFFHGTWKDAAMSSALAIIPATLMLVAKEFSQLWWIYECSSCFLVSMAATALSKHFCYSTLILSASIALLPGFTISMSVVEIMTKNILAGSIRLCYAVVHLACMTLGLTLAPILWNASWDGSGNGFQRKPVGGRTCAAENTIAVNHFWLFLCVPLYIGAYNVYLKAPLRQWPLMITVGCIGYSVGYASKHVWHAPPEVNAFAASFTLGLLANLYTLATDRFSFNAIVAGIFIQVPGSWGLRGLLAMAYAV
ncbi:hypothetical protein MMC07_007762 [Pseudocyphellaria aurata]|nr:hypothetical protein [Pseudocyphellaria aurata]